MKNLPTLRELRKQAEVERLRLYRLGGQWVSAVWNDAMGLWDERYEPYWYNGHSECEMLAVKLGYDLE